MLDSPIRRSAKRGLPSLSSRSLISTTRLYSWTTNGISDFIRRSRMCLVCVCDEDERVLGTQTAPGACPFCGGMIRAMDVQSEWRFCFLPLYFKTKRKFYCTVCARRLVVQ
ncbi:hypothetical protein WN943_000130 [Citrus x changshan-huyou]